MILSKKVFIHWNPKTKTYYESKGYCFTQWNEEFEIDVLDLLFGSSTTIQVKCDCEYCENPVKTMKYYSYNKCLRENGKYYCIKCASRLASEKVKKTKLFKSKSFEQWCIENNRQDVLDRWDFEINKCKPEDICFSANKKYFF